MNWGELAGPVLLLALTGFGVWLLNRHPSRIEDELSRQARKQREDDRARMAERRDALTRRPS